MARTPRMRYYLPQSILGNLKELPRKGIPLTIAEAIRIASGDSNLLEKQDLEKYSKQRMIYILKDQYRDLFKVGSSTQPYQRMIELSQEIRTPLTMEYLAIGNDAGIKKLGMDNVIHPVQHGGQTEWYRESEATYNGLFEIIDRTAHAAIKIAEKGTLMSSREKIRFLVKMPENLKEKLHKKKSGIRGQSKILEGILQDAITSGFFNRYKLPEQYQLQF